MAEGGLGSRGAYIGRGLYGGAYFYDPWVLYSQGIHGPNMLVFGQIGYAKSSLVKCLDEATEIVDPRTGIVRSLGEVFEDPSLTDVLTLADRRRIEAVPTPAKVAPGPAECLRVTFASGRSVTTTHEHPYLTAGGWRRADHMKVGETAAVAGRVPFPSEPVDL